MRLAFRIAAMAAAAACFAQTAAAATSLARPPQRIMSLNQCTDLLLLELVPRSRIASVSFLAHEAVETLFPGRDAGIPVNHGAAEDVIRFRPDLILAADFSTPMTRKLASRLGAPVVVVNSATTFDDLRAAIRQVGSAVGEPLRAEALVQGMDAKLAALAADPPGRRPRVVAWGGGGAVPGRDTLANAIIAAAGGVNIAALPGANTSTFDVEQLLLAKPDALLYGGGSADAPSWRQAEGQHRLVRRIYGARRIAYNEALYTCGLPQSADAAAALRRALDALPPQPPGSR
jgi:iron complex transport system substrate-binding protein